MALEFFFRWLLDNGGQPAPKGLTKENRSLERYTWRESELATLELTSGERGAVRDVSYGSIATTLKASRGGFELAEGKLTGRLKVLDVSVPVVLKPVRSTYVENGAYTAFLFLHESTDSLVFLREMIEPLRSAQSLAPLSRSVLNDRYKGTEWECWRGDGPTDLVVKMSADKKTLVEALFTYRMGSDYREVAYRDGKAETRISMDDDGHWNRMATDRTLDAEALRHAACFFAGLEDGLRGKLKAFLQVCVKELAKKGEGRTTAA